MLLKINLIIVIIVKCHSEHIFVKKKLYLKFAEIIWCEKYFYKSFYRKR